MRIIAFVLEPPVIERILRHVGEPTEPPAILPARPPPQAEFAFNQDGGHDEQDGHDPGDRREGANRSGVRARRGERAAA